MRKMMDSHSDQLTKCWSKSRKQQKYVNRLPYFGKEKEERNTEEDDNGAAEMII